MFEIIENEERTSEENMHFDAEKLKKISDKENPILHFYAWKQPSLTYGYFIQPEKFLNLKKCEEHGISYARRPTGGGIIFHIWDLAFGVIIPKGHPGYSVNTLSNYAYINEKVKKAVERLLALSNCSLLEADPTDPRPYVSHFCMAKPTIYDVMLQGKKIAGAAQRRRNNAFLHQGSISLSMPNFSLLKEILLEDSVIEAMQQNTFAPFKGSFKGASFEGVKQQLKQLLINEFQRD